MSKMPSWNGLELSRWLIKINTLTKKFRQSNAKSEKLIRIVSMKRRICLDLWGVWATRKASIIYKIIAKRNRRAYITAASLMRMKRVYLSSIILKICRIWTVAVSLEIINTTSMYRTLKNSKNLFWRLIKYDNLEQKSHLLISKISIKKTPTSIKALES